MDKQLMSSKIMPIEPEGGGEEDNGDDNDNDDEQRNGEAPDG